jgi:hypothetical protein
VERIGNKVSYIRKPLARFSYVSAGLAVVSLVLTVAALGFSYYTRGNVPLWTAAVGFCGILFGAVSVLYGIFSFMEKEKNYLLAKVSLAGAGSVLFLWLIVLIV